MPVLPSFAVALYARALTNEFNAGRFYQAIWDMILCCQIGGILLFDSLAFQSASQNMRKLTWVKSGLHRTHPFCQIQSIYCISHQCESTIHQREFNQYNIGSQKHKANSAEWKTRSSSCYLHKNRQDTCHLWATCLVMIWDVSPTMHGLKSP